MRVRALLLLCPLALSGCTSMHNPIVRGDLYETQARGAAALNGDVAAYKRLAVLGERWSNRAGNDWCHKAAVWDYHNQDRAAAVADGVERLLLARDAVLSQQELGTVMSSALRDLESEYDVIIETLESGDAAPADLRIAAEQKYLARRMIGSLAQMVHSDMSQAVEAADTFGRDVYRFQQLLDAALNGNDDLGVEPSEDPEVQDSLAQIEELFTGYVADSAPDVLENVVSRYDGWLALKELAALTPATSKRADRKAAKAAKAGKAADAAADAADKAAADMAGDDDGAGDVGVEDAGVDEFADDPAAEDDMPIDEPPADDEAMDDDAIDDGAVDDSVGDDMADDMADDPGADAP